MYDRDITHLLLKFQRRLAKTEVQITQIQARLSERIDHVSEQARHNANVIEDLNVVKHTVQRIIEHLESTQASQVSAKKQRVQFVVTFGLGIVSALIIEWIRFRFGG